VRFVTVLLSSIAIEISIVGERLIVPEKRIGTENGNQ